MSDRYGDPNAASIARFQAKQHGLSLMVRHLCNQHNYSVRQINLELGITDKQVRAFLDE